MGKGKESREGNGLIHWLWLNLEKLESLTFGLYEICESRNNRKSRKRDFRDLPFLGEPKTMTKKKAPKKDTPAPDGMQLDEMRKEDAAKLLGCSVRSIENYTKQGRIGVRYEKSKTRPIALYNRADLERLKEELEQTLHAPSIVQPDRVGATGSIALARVQPAPPEMFAAFAQLLTAAKEQAEQGNKEPTILELAQMPLLKLHEAQRYSNISRADLLEAIKANKLKAKKTGRGWKIRRELLDEYIKKNF